MCAHYYIVVEMMFQTSAAANIGVSGWKSRIYYLAVTDSPFLNHKLSYQKQMMFPEGITIELWLLAVASYTHVVVHQITSGEFRCCVRVFNNS